MQDNVALPDPVTLVGATVHEVLLVVRLTTPAKPFTADMVIVEMPAAFAFTVTLVGLAAIVKSRTMNVTVTECEIAPLVPVTATWTVEADANVHDRVELPEVVTLVGLSVHAVLLLARLTVPVKPLSGAIVIVEVPADPAFTVTVVGLAVIVKSAAAVKVTVTEWVSAALVAVTPTWNIPPVAKVHDSVEEPEPVTLVGETVHEVLLVVRLTTPAKPFRPVMVMVEVAAVPGLKVTVVGLAAMVKSWTTNVTVTE